MTEANGDDKVKIKRWITILLYFNFSWIKNVESPIAAGPLWRIRAMKITICNDVPPPYKSLNAADPNANPSDKECTTRPIVEINVCDPSPWKW